LYWTKQFDSKLFLGITLETQLMTLAMLFVSNVSMVDSADACESTGSTLIVGDYIIGANGRMLCEPDFARPFSELLNDTPCCMALRYRRHHLSEDARQLFLAKFSAAKAELTDEERAIVNRISGLNDVEHGEEREYVGVATWREFDLTRDGYQVFDVLTFLNLLLRICAAFKELRALDALCIEKTFTETCYPRVSMHCEGSTPRKDCYMMSNTLRRGLPAAFDQYDRVN
jgi:hypothetical protein